MKWFVAVKLALFALSVSWAIYAMRQIELWAGIFEHPAAGVKTLGAIMAQLQIYSVVFGPSVISLLILLFAKRRGKTNS